MFTSFVFLLFFLLLSSLATRLLVFGLPHWGNMFVHSTESGQSPCFVADHTSYKAASLSLEREGLVLSLPLFPL